MIEKFSAPKKVVKRQERQEVKDGLSEFFAAQKKKKGDRFSLKERVGKEEVKRAVYATDPYEKALTGRTPERIQEETGIDREVMFPSGKKILYVGDPWQRMGKEIDDPNFVLIDYEFGEVAEFETSDEKLQTELSFRAKHFLDNMRDSSVYEALTREDKEWCEKFGRLVGTASRFLEEADTLQKYPETARAWQTAREFVEDSYRKEVEALEAKGYEPGDKVDNGSMISAIRTNAWYLCMRGERGFSDLFEWHTTIEPRLQEEREKLLERRLPSEKINERIEKLKRSLIEELRLRKRPEKAQVVEALFPQLPFRDNTFDRFVASWSISAHAFGEFSEKDFSACWQEVWRVLKENGEAFIFPLNYTSFDEEAFFNSLGALETEDKIEWRLLDELGEEVDDLVHAETLWIKKIREDAYGL